MRRYKEVIRLYVALVWFLLSAGVGVSKMCFFCVCVCVQKKKCALPEAAPPHHTKDYVEFLLNNYEILITINSGRLPRPGIIEDDSPLFSLRKITKVAGKVTNVAGNLATAVAQGITGSRSDLGRDNILAQVFFLFSSWPQSEV